MADLFKKINVLVKSSINDILGDDLTIGASRRQPLNPARLGKDIDREIAALRQRINEALAYEDELQARVQTLNNEVAQWDQQADDAVAREDDASARYAIEQMQRTRQRLTMAESDLDAHRLVAQELIQRVNMLDAAVADARRAQDESQPEQAQAGEAGASMPGRMLADVLREAREKIAALGDIVSAQQEMTNPPAPKEVGPIDDDSVADDLAQRRDRLSKK